MDTVTVVFTNGEIVSFVAQEFDANLTEDRSYINKYPYKTAQGEESFIYLKPAEIAGVFLTKSVGRNDAPITYTVARPR